MEVAPHYKLLTLLWVTQIQKWMKNVQVKVIASSLAYQPMSDPSLVLSARAETEKLLKKAKTVKADKIMTPGKKGVNYCLELAFIFHQVCGVARMHVQAS